MTAPNRQTRIRPSQKRQMQKTRHKEGEKQRSPKATYINCRKIPCKALDEGQTHPSCSIQPTGPRSSSLNQSSSPNPSTHSIHHSDKPIHWTDQPLQPIRRSSPTQSSKQPLPKQPKPAENPHTQSQNKKQFPLSNDREKTELKRTNPSF